MSIIRDIQATVPDCTYHVNIALGSLHSALEQYCVDLDPVYQRGHIWNEKQESLFVGALIENHNAIPPLWFNWTNKRFKKSDSEVVDGKQRIKACIRWLNNEISALCPCGTEVMYNNLDEIDLSIIQNSVMMDWNFVDLSSKEVMHFYIRLNSGGTVHTEEDLNKVRSFIKNLK